LLEGVDVVADVHVVDFAVEQRSDLRGLRERLEHDFTAYL